jgi:hypothetical protein
MKTIGQIKLPPRTESIVRVTAGIAAGRDDQKVRNTRRGYYSDSLKNVVDGCHDKYFD